MHFSTIVITLFILMLFVSLTERLRALARRPGPLLASVEGRPGLSPLPFVLEATDPARRLVFEPPALTDDGNRQALAERLRRFAGDPRVQRTEGRRHGAEDRFPPWRFRPRTAPARTARSPADDWPSLFAALQRAAPLTLVVNKPEGFTAANRRFWNMLGEAWLSIRRRGQRVHLILASAERGLGRRLNAPGSAFRDPGASLGQRAAPDPAEVVHAEPGSHYDLATAAPEWRGRDLLLGWALFGGLPGTWAAAGLRGARSGETAAGPGTPPGDGAAAGLGMSAHTGATASARTAHAGEGRQRAPGDALRACLADPASPLASAPRDELERHVQKTRRYAAILSAVARGASGWREVADALGADSGRGSLGPYMQHLRRLGLVAAERPLGAPASGRRTRYRLADPFEAMWWADLHPARSELLSPTGVQRAWAARVEPRLPRYLEAALPRICRNYLRFGCASLLGAVARRTGPLWGSGYDFPAVATLANGAVCYAHVHAGPRPAKPSALKSLEAEMRKAPFGRGRQSRFRLLVSVAGFTEPLRREAARNPFVRLADAETLAALPASKTPEPPPL